MIEFSERRRSEVHAMFPRVDERYACKHGDDLYKAACKYNTLRNEIDPNAEPLLFAKQITRCQRAKDRLLEIHSRIA